MQTPTIKKGVITLAIMSSLLFGGEYDDLFSDIEETTSSSSEEGSEEDDNKGGGSSSEREKLISFNGEHTLNLALPLTEGHREFTGLMRGPYAQSRFYLTGDKGPVSFDAGVEVNIYEENDRTQVEFLPKEIVAKLNLGDFRFALGYQNYVWGSADGFNPTDNINSVDYRFGPNGEKISVFGADVTWYATDKMSLQAIYIPIKKSDRYPHTDDDVIPAALFASPYFSSVTMNGANPDPTIGVKEYPQDVALHMPDKTPANSVGGGKWSLFLSKMDLSFSYLYDFDKYFTPGLTLAQRSMVQPETQWDSSVLDPVKDALAQQSVYGLESVVLTKQRVHRMGVDFRSSIERVGIWGEFNYSLFENSDNQYGVNRSTLAGVIGADISFGESQQHYWNVQLAGNYIPGYDTDRFTDYPGGRPNSDSLGSESYMEEYYFRSLAHNLAFETEQVKIGVATKVEWDIAAAYLKPSIQVAYFFPFNYSPEIERFGDIGGKIALEYRATDNLKLIVGGEGYYSMTKKVGSDTMFNNPANSLGFFNAENRLFFNAVYYWGI